MGRKRVYKVEFKLNEEQKTVLERRYGSTENFAACIMEREFQGWEQVTVVKKKPLASIRPPRDIRKDNIRLEDF